MNREICFECDATGDIHQHHVVPKSLGGTRTIPLCVECHGKVHGRDYLKHTRLARIAREKKRQETGRCEGRKPFGHTPEEKVTLARMEELRYRRDKIPRSLRVIAATLDAEGLSSRSGKPWTAQTVKRILGRSIPPKVLPRPKDQPYWPLEIGECLQKEDQVLNKDGKNWSAIRIRLIGQTPHPDSIHSFRCPLNRATV